MSLIADKVKYIKPSPTLAVTNKAQELKSQGKDIIDLGVGEPDFDTPDNIKEAAIKAIRNGKTKYTQVDGIKELKQAICDKFQNENNIQYNIDEITVGVGAKQVIFNAFMASLNPTDEVIIPAPYWVSYPAMVELSGGKPIIVDCTDSDFKITRDKLEKIINENTKWLILNSPSNPTGICYTKKELQDIADVLKNYKHVYILSDDIYEHLIYEDEFYTIAQIAPELKERILTVNGVSKSYAMTGWRIGYAGGMKELIKAISKIQSQSTSNPCSISQYASLEALKGNQNFIEESKKIFSNRRNLAIKLLQEIPEFGIVKPNGAFYLFINIQKCFGKKTETGKVINTSNDFVEYLLENGAAAVPGIAFGAEGYFRMSYALNEELLIEACNRIKNTVSKLI